MASGGNTVKPRLSPRVQDEYRAKIDINLICKSLKEHIKGTLEMSATQIRASEILLKKVLPDLASITVSGDQDNPFLIKDISAKPLEAKSTTWLEHNTIEHEETVQ